MMLCVHVQHISPVMVQDYESVSGRLMSIDRRLVMQAAVEPGRGGG